MKTLVAAGLTTLALLTLGWSLGSAGGPVAATGASRAEAQASEHRAKKQAHFFAVVADLSNRDVTHLSQAQLVARRSALAELARYALAGTFPAEGRWKGFGVPYLIDDFGTRCALAHLVDQTGDGALIKRLAKTHNHAFVPGLVDDRELRVWLHDNGLSVEEAAFIQLPPFMDDGEGIEDDPEPIDDGPRETDAPVKAPPSAGNGSQTEPALGGRRPTRSARRSAPSWQGWWELNRQAFVDLRTRYHDAAVVTPHEGATAARGRRPGDVDRQHVLAPLFAKLTSEGGDIGAAALMAWARMGRAEDAPRITDHALAYVAKDSNKHRGLMLLAVGLAGTPRGAQVLTDILKDTPAGRHQLAKRSPVSTSVRAFAAIALGLSSKVVAIDALLGTLSNPKGREADLRACCVAALGHLGRAAPSMQRARIRGVLVEGVRTRAWADEVLAAVPAAFVRMRDDPGLLALQDDLARFRKPLAARRSVALALGAAEGTAARRSIEILLESARRDPDPLVRRYAIVGLGQRTPAAEVKTKEALELRRLIGRFYLSALQGHHVQHADRPWVYLGAALYAKRDAAQAARVGAQLRKALEGSGDRGTRSAAAIAVGLLGGADGRDSLRRLLAKARDKELRPYAAEALGIIGDAASQAPLLALLTKDASTKVRYRAALGLGYLADRKLVGELTAALATARSAPVRATLTRVIGELGDRGAIRPLAALASDTKEDDLTRARAIAALGLIGESAQPTWTQGFKRGANRANATPTLTIVLSIF